MFNANGGRHGRTTDTEASGVCVWTRRGPTATGGHPRTGGVPLSVSVLGAEFTIRELPAAVDCDQTPRDPCSELVPYLALRRLLATSARCLLYRPVRCRHHATPMQPQTVTSPPSMCITTEQVVQRKLTDAAQLSTVGFHLSSLRPNF